ncbi:nicotinate-nucleotide adenylyltransferase [Longirhabdus pacifica]|uniref:nicotinate-nucleotide adenylyltransferase n=1 Tax=Longirhabdus pacifica TaxID=2305227 RepID=UPI001F0B7B81|nr:nicotinate-nucleotide adenylyltransferase [Longirhabdus pacifica]
MGGTFDPPHLGHLIAAQSAWEQMELDEVWFLPTYHPPHKNHQVVATANQRLQMVKCCTVDHPAFRVCDVELKTRETSYTIKTMEQLQAQYPAYEFYFIIGADMIMYLPQWFEIEKLINMVTFVGVKRSSTVIDWDALPPEIAKKVTMVSMPSIDISSTAIRERLKRGQSIQYYVHAGVNEYVKGNHIYES